MKKDMEEIRQALRQGLQPLRKIREQASMSPDDYPVPGRAVSSEPIPAGTPEEMVPEDLVAEDGLVDEQEIVSTFPTETVQSLLSAVIGMSLTSAIKDLADELSGNYGLDALDTHLRLHRFLMEQDRVEEAATSLTALVKAARQQQAVEETSGE